MAHCRNFHYVAEGAVLVPLNLDAQDKPADPEFLLRRRGRLEGVLKIVHVAGDGVR